MTFHFFFKKVLFNKCLVEEDRPILSVDYCLSPSTFEFNISGIFFSDILPSSYHYTVYYHFLVLSSHTTMLSSIVVFNKTVEYDNDTIHYYFTPHLELIQSDIERFVQKKINVEKIHQSEYDRDLINLLAVVQLMAPWVFPQILCYSV